MSSLWLSICLFTRAAFLNMPTVKTNIRGVSGLWLLMSSAVIYVTKTHPRKQLFFKRIGNLISLFLLSMLTTEPETSNHGKITFLEHSYSIQVQQTPLLMPVLGSTPFLGQKIFNLGHNVPDEYCFQPKAERCWGEHFLHFLCFKGEVSGKLLKPRNRTSATLCTGIKQPLWGLLSATGITKGIWKSSTRRAVKPSWGHLGEHCKCRV